MRIHHGKLAYWVAQGLLPAMHQDRHRMVWTEDEFAVVKSIMGLPVPCRVRQGYYSFSAMAEACGVRPAHLRSLARQGRVPQPSEVVGKRRFYTAAFLPIMRRILAVVAKGKYQRLESEGFYSMEATARHLNIPKITFDFWRRFRNLPKPENGTLYTLPEIDALRQYMADNGYKNRRPNTWKSLTY